jgi:lysophospholipase L1-like esterase
MQNNNIRVTMAGKEHSSKLDELAEKSAGKHGGCSAHYIIANQALRDDVFAMIDNKIAPLMDVMFDIKNKLQKCQTELEESKVREKALVAKVTALEIKINKDDDVSPNDYYIVGSSILREVRSDDISNGHVKCIRGGLISDVNKDIQSLKSVPKNIVTQIGGNDLEKDDATAETVSSDYALMLTNVKTKFPDAKVIVSGLPPRFSNETIRTKAKDLNESLKKWADENEIQFIENEESFELKSGDVDKSAYVMTGEMPRLHLNRSGTVRLLENMEKHVSGLKLSDRLHDPIVQKKSFAQVVANVPNVLNTGQWETQRRRQYPRTQQNQSGGCKPNEWNSPRCYYCGENNHTSETCRFDQRIRCHSCQKYGHKSKTCFSNK